MEDPRDSTRHALESLVALRERAVVETRYQVAGITAYALFLSQQPNNTWPGIVATLAAAISALYFVFVYFYAYMDELGQRSEYSNFVNGRSTAAFEGRSLSWSFLYKLSMWCAAISVIALIFASLFPDLMPFEGKATS